MIIRKIVQKNIKNSMYLKLLILIIVIIPSYDLFSSKINEDFITDFKTLPNKDTLVFKRIPNHYGLGLNGNFFYSSIYGDFFVPDNVQLIEESTFLRYNNSKGIGFMIGPSLELFSILQNINLSFSTSYKYFIITSEKEMVYSSSKNHYELDASFHIASLSISSLMQLFSSNYYILFGLFYDKLLFGELKQKEFINNSSTLNYEYSLKNKKYDDGYGASVGIKVYKLVALSDKYNRFYLNPSVNIQYQHIPYTDYGTILKSLSLSVGVELLLVSEKIEMDTFKYSIQIDEIKLAKHHDGENEKSFHKNNSEIKSNDLGNIDIQLYEYNYAEAPTFRRNKLQKSYNKVNNIIQINNLDDFFERNFIKEMCDNISQENISSKKILININFKNSKALSRQLKDKFEKKIKTYLNVRNQLFLIELKWIQNNKLRDNYEIQIELLDS